MRRMLPRIAPRDMRGAVAAQYGVGTAGRWALELSPVDIWADQTRREVAPTPLRKSDIAAHAAPHRPCRRCVIFGHDDAHPPTMGLPSKQKDQRVKFYRSKDEAAACKSDG